MAIKTIYQGPNGAVGIDTQQNVTVSANYALQPSDYIVTATGAGSFTITLQPAGISNGKNVLIKCLTTAPITVAAYSGELIDASSSRSLANGEVLDIVSDGTKWVDTVGTSISGSKIIDGTISNSKLSSNSVTADKIATGAVGNDEISTSASPTVNTIYTNNWFRSNGQTGWYNETYGGGIRMEDSTWIRTYGSKNFYSDQEIRGNRLNAESYIEYGPGNTWGLVKTERISGLGSLKKYTRSYSGSNANTYPGIFTLRTNRGWTSFYLKVSMELYGYLGTSRGNDLYIYMDDANPWRLWYSVTIGRYSGSAMFNINIAITESGPVDVGYSEFYLYFNPLGPYTGAIVQLEMGNLSVVSSFSGNSHNQIILY